MPQVSRDLFCVVLTKFKECIPPILPNFGNAFLEFGNWHFLLLRGEVGDDGFGFGGADDFGEVAFGLEFDFFYAAEFQE